MRMNMINLLSAQAFDASLLEDVKFYVILALLAAALIAIIVIFARWDAFKAKKKEEEQGKMKLDQTEIIKVSDRKKSVIIGKDADLEVKDITN